MGLRVCLLDDMRTATACQTSALAVTAPSALQADATAVALSQAESQVSVCCTRCF